MARRLHFSRLSLSEQPLFFFSLAFIGGLLLASSFSISASVWLLGGLAAWLLAGVRLWRRRGGGVVTGILLLGCLGAGGALGALREREAGPERVRRMLERGEVSAAEPVELYGTLESAPELAPDRIYLRIAVERLATLGRERPASGSVQITAPFSDDESRAEYDALGIDYGARVRVLCALRDRGGYRNPGAPDFDELLEDRGLDARGMVKSPLLIERLGEGTSSAALRALYGVRSRALSATLRRFQQPAAGILAAALFGNRYFLLRGPAESFRGGGTFHLLVISGSHVAMIAAVALWASARGIRSRAGRYSLVVALMWSYALMVGAEPSITRAVVMLTIVVVGRLLFRQSIGTNLLAAAAIILLAWQPRDLFNPGFQLSFLTVFAIVGFTAPLYLRLRAIGQWRPSAATPYPPLAPGWVRCLAEALFWDERAFRAEMAEAHIRYRLQKTRAASILNRWRLQTPLTAIATTLLTTTSVQIGLLPMMLHYFHRFSMISPAANVVESALISLLMIAGAIFLALHALLGEWVAPLAGVVDGLARLIVASGDWMLARRGAAFRVPDWGTGWQWVFAAFFCAALLLVVCLDLSNPLRKGDESRDARRRRLGRIAVPCALLTMATLGALLTLHPFEHEYEHGRLSVTFLDVGQGDAMLLRFPRGGTMLLDSGGRPAYRGGFDAEPEDELLVEDRLGIGEAAVMPFLWHCGIGRLDWIVASHGDADHVEGFGEIARAFEIGRALRGPSSRLSGAFGPDLFDRAVRLANAPLQRAARGDRIEIDGVTIETLSPDAEFAAAPRSANNGSLVLRVVYGGRRFLFTGDIERDAEARLCASAEDLRADVLKVAHHGSRTSSTSEFLQRVRPAHAVISVAEPSPFGHPHPDALARLQASGARVWRTSRCGAITLSTDGGDLRLETAVKCESDPQSRDTASRSSPER
ncbi:MAG: ComEC/Rec2 family competence protein [Blastocatellia bacterium]|nr:ComEC/Rec2 family competence protein [Blastocatellia bacterium]